MRRLAIFLTLALGLTAAPALAFFSLSGFQNSMIEFLIDQLSTEGEFEITVEEITDNEEGATEIRGLSIRDSEGVWFTAEVLDFAWDPSRLLRGEVEFSRLAMTGVEILRPPITPEGEPEPEEPADPDAPLIPEIAWPRSPLTLKVDGLALERVRIAEPVLGHELAFDATGSARDEGDIQSVTLDLTRTDAVAGRIDLSYARNFSDNTLKVNLTAREDAGGLIAALSGLPDDAASNVTLRADGPPEDWRATLDLDLAETVAVTGNAVIAYQGPLKIDTTLTARPGEQLDPQIAALLGTEAEIVARVTEGEDGTILIDEGRITSPDLNLTAAGNYARPTGAVDLTVDLAAGTRLAEPFDGVDFGGLTFVGQVQGAPGSIAADGDLILDGLATAPVDVTRAELAVDVRQSPSGDQTATALDIRGLTRGLRLDKIAAGVIGDADLTVDVDLTGDALTIGTVGLASQVLTVSVSGSADIATTDADIRFSLAAPQIEPVAGAYGVDARGTIDISGQAQRQNEETTLTVETTLSDFAHPMADAEALTIDGEIVQAGETISFDVDGTAESLRLDRIGPDLLPRATFDVDGDLQGDLLDLTKLDLISPLLETRVAGKMNIADQTGEIRYQLETPDLGPVAQLYEQPASGVLTAEGVATLRGETPPQVTGDLSIEGLVWDGTPYGMLTLAHDVEASAAPKGSLNLTSEGSQYGPARIATDFALTQPQLEISSLDAEALGLAVKGAVSANLDGPLADGEFTISAPDLSTLKAVTGAPLSGSARGDLVLSTASGQQGAALNLTANGVNTGDARIDSARLSAQLADLLGTPQVDVRVDADGVAAGDIALDSTSAAVKGPLSRLDFSGETRGNMGDKPLSAALSGTADVANPAVRVTLARLDAALAEDRVALNQALQVTSQGGTVAAKGLDLSIPDGGRVWGDVTSYGAPLSGEIRLNAPKLDFLKRLANVPIAGGGIEAEMAFDTRRRRANGTVTGRDIVFEGIDATGGLDLDTRIDWQGRAADVNTTVTGDFGNPLELTARIPVDGAQPFPGIASRGPVQTKIDWQGEIGKLWALVPAPGHLLTGQTTIDLGISGDISRPEITGGIRVADGGYQNLDVGTILTALSLETTLAPGGTLAISLSASDGAKGTVKTEGTVALDASGIDIQTTIDRAVLVRRDDVLARLGGNISVKGPVEALAVTGEILIDEAEIRLVNANPPGLVELDEVLLKGEPEPEETEASSNVTLTLDVNSPGRMFVRGRGLDSEWKMSLRIRGDAAAPRVTGRIEKVRGSLDLIGKRFDLSQGRIDFLEGKKIDPLIDIVLERKTSDLTGRIIVNGPASDPQLSFSSTPSLPEDEVLPRTLFGTSSQGLSGTQAIQLGIGLATLMDGGGGALDTVRGTVGLDSLQVEQDEDGQSAIALGKEVAEGVWVGSKQVLGAGHTAVEVEIEIIDDVLIETEIDPVEGATVGLEWKKDF